MSSFLHQSRNIDEDLSPFLDRLNANLEKALSKKKKKSKNDAGDAQVTVDAKIVFVKNGDVIEPDLSAKVKDFVFQVIEAVISQIQLMVTGSYFRSVSSNSAEFVKLDKECSLIKGMLCNLRYN